VKFAIFFISMAIGDDCGKVSFRDNAIAAAADPALSILLGLFLPLPYSVMPYRATLIASKGLLLLAAANLTPLPPFDGFPHRRGLSGQARVADR
jgi:hypothetical protein